ncbi:hypothetical protein ABIA41_002516 [Bradyrhizobium sp. USDA 313]
MSETKASSGETFWPPLVMPNSAACLIALTVSPPALASPDDLGFGSLGLQQERGEIRRVERMAHAAEHLAAGLGHDTAGVLLQVLAEGVIGGEEEPGVETRLHSRKTGHIGLAVGIEHVVDRVGTTGLVGETDRARAVEHDDLVARFRDLAGGKRGRGGRDVVDHLDALIVEHVACDVGGEIGLVEMVGRQHLDLAPQHLATKVLDGHFGRGLAAGTGDVGIQARHVEDAADLQRRLVLSLRHTGTQCKSGGKNARQNSLHRKRSPLSRRTLMAAWLLLLVIAVRYRYCRNPAAGATAQQARGGCKSANAAHDFRKAEW